MDVTIINLRSKAIEIAAMINQNHDGITGLLNKATIILDYIKTGNSTPEIEFDKVSEN